MDDSTHKLLLSAAKGNLRAQRTLMTRYRARLIRMIQIRMDDRLAARLDPSDVVQEALLDAAQNLQDCLKLPSGSFYLWLRGLAMNRLIDHYRKNILASRRSVNRELPLPEGSKCILVDHFTAKGPSPSDNAQKLEKHQLVRVAIDQLEANQREVIVLRYLEELSVEEISKVLKVSVRTVWRWHRTAVVKLAEVLSID